MILDYIYIYIRHQLRKWSSWKCTNHPCWHSRLHHNSKCMINMRCIQNQACRWKFDYKTWFSWYQSHQLYQYPIILYPIYNYRLKIGNCKYVTSFSPIVTKQSGFSLEFQLQTDMGQKLNLSGIMCRLLHHDSDIMAKCASHFTCKFQT